MSKLDVCCATSVHVRFCLGKRLRSLPNDRVTYSVGTLTSLLGALLDSCSYQASQPLDQTRQAARCSRSLVLGGVGGSVSWNPRVRVQTQSTDPAGTYSGTITHSVA